MTVAEHTAAVEKVKALTKQARDEIKKAESEISSLEGRMPRLLAGERLGEVTQDEVNTVRAEIRTLQGFLNESGWLLAGLAEIEAERQAALTAANREETRARNEQRLAELMSEFRKECEAGIVNKRTEGDLRQTAASLGRLWELKPFIKEMTLLRDRTPSEDFGRK